MTNCYFGFGRVITAWMDREIVFSDDRFEGLITPTPDGNLVVVDEKEESIQIYSTMLAANIN